MDKYITVDLVKVFLEYGVYSIVAGVIFIGVFELLVMGIVKAFHLLKM